MTDPTGRCNSTPSAPNAAAVAACLFIVAGATFGMAGIMTVVGHSSTMADGQGRARHRRGLPRRAAALARSGQLTTLIRWHRRLTTGATAQGAELSDRSRRGTCVRCGDLKGRVHECKDFGR